MEKKRNEIRDCNFERDTGFGDLTKRESGNAILKSRDPGCPGRKCTNTIKLSSSGMSEIDQQKATIQSRGYCDSCMRSFDLSLSVFVNLGRDNILWIQFHKRLFVTFC